jgi:hypothetical protein
MAVLLQHQVSIEGFSNLILVHCLCKVPQLTRKVFIRARRRMRKGPRHLKRTACHRIAHFIAIAVVRTTVMGHSWVIMPKVQQELLARQLMKGFLSAKSNALKKSTASHTHALCTVVRVRGEDRIRQQLQEVVVLLAIQSLLQLLLRDAPRAFMQRVQAIISATATNVQQQP